MKSKFLQTNHVLIHVLIIPSLLLLLNCNGAGSKGEGRVRNSSSATSEPAKEDDKKSDETKDEETKDDDSGKTGSGDGGESGGSGSSLGGTGGSLGGATGGTGTTGTSGQLSDSKSYNQAELTSLLKKQKSQGTDSTGACGGTRVSVDDNCYSTVEYCSILNHGGNTYTPDDDSKVCKLTKDSCKPYQVIKEVTVKLDDAGTQTVDVEVCQDDKEKCAAPNYLWTPVEANSAEELNYQYQQGGKCTITTEGCNSRYEGSSLIEGKNACTPTPLYCIEMENKFFKENAGENGAGECVLEANFTATEAGCKAHGMSYNATAIKCYHNTSAGCSAVNNVWLTEDQMSQLNRLHTQQAGVALAEDNFEGSKEIANFYNKVIVPNTAQYIESGTLSSSAQCQAPSIHSCQLPDSKVFDSIKNQCVTSFTIILYMRVNKFSFDYNDTCKDDILWWNYDTDSLYVNHFYINLQSKTSQVDGIKLVENGLSDKIKLSPGLTHKYYDYHKSMVVEVAKDFSIEVRPEVYRYSGVKSLWLNGEKTYHFQDGDNWDLSKTHKEIFEQATDVNGVSCKAYLEFQWRWIQIRS